MKIEKVRIQNYKGLRDITIPIASFGCIIGENNAGKSSILQALKLFFSGTSLTTSSYFDATQQIRIAVTFAEITDEDLNRLAPEHKIRVEEILFERSITFVRLYGLDGKSTFRYEKFVPQEVRFKQDSIDELVRGLKGSSLRDAVIRSHPKTLRSRMTIQPS